MAYTEIVLNVLLEASFNSLNKLYLKTKKALMVTHNGFFYFRIECISSLYQSLSIYLYSLKLETHFLLSPILLLPLPLMNDR